LGHKKRYRRPDEKGRAEKKLVADAGESSKVDEVRTRRRTGVGGVRDSAESKQRKLQEKQKERQKSYGKKRG